MKGAVLFRALLFFEICHLEVTPSMVPYRKVSRSAESGKPINGAWEAGWPSRFSSGFTAALMSLFFSA